MDALVANDPLSWLLSCPGFALSLSSSGALHVCSFFGKGMQSVTDERNTSYVTRPSELSKEDLSTYKTMLRHLGEVMHRRLMQLNLAKGPGMNLYEVVNSLVKPWTRGTGNSIALLLNNSNPKKAEVMVSHAWNGAIFETLVSLQGKLEVLELSEETVCWFCAFSQVNAAHVQEPGT